ncbi:hypothetical protein DS67_00630 [Mesotoga sp. SC_4PWA21]|nr:hypothetical protein DS67_00630 [Mesotoga sp. SC_4PWA21]
MKRMLFIILVSSAALAAVLGLGLLRRQTQDFELLQTEAIRIKFGEQLSLSLTDLVKSNGNSLSFSVVGGNGKIVDDLLLIDSRQLNLPKDNVEIVVQSDTLTAVIPIEVLIENSLQPPLLRIDNKKLLEGETLEIDLREVTISESGNVKYELVSGVGFIKDYKYSYTATFTEAPSAHRVTIKAIDELKQWHCETFSIIIMDKNQWPLEPFSPFPEDGIEDFFSDLVLSWKCADPDGDPLSYDLFFGSAELEKLVENITENHYSLPPLEDGVRYFWQVVADDGKGGSVKSPIWSFSTKTIPGLLWKRIMGSESRDIFTRVRALSDGSLILAGSSESFTLTNATPGSPSRDGWIVRLDGNGYLAWQKRFDLGWTEFSDVIATSDGGFLVSGRVHGSSGMKIGESSTLIAIKLDRFANESWRFQIHGPLCEAASVIESEDVYFLLGTNSSLDGIKSDVVLLKLDNFGKEVWRKSFGGSSFDRAVAFDLDPNGDIVIVAETTSDDGDAEGNSGSKLTVNEITIEFSSTLVLKVSREGNLIWSRVLAGETEVSPSSVKVDPSGDIFISGSTNSTNGTFSHRQSPDYDGYVVKVSTEGEVLWTKTFGGDGNDVIKDFYLTPSGGVQAVGFSESNVSSTGHESSSLRKTGLTHSDFWILQLDNNGRLLWQTFLGGDMEDVGLSIASCGDGFAVAGYSASNDGDVGSNRGEFDAVVFYLH